MQLLDNMQPMGQHLITQRGDGLGGFAKMSRPKPMIVCEECGELLQRSSLGRHRQRRHGAPTASIRDILPLKNSNMPHVPRTGSGASPTKKMPKAPRAPKGEKARMAMNYGGVDAHGYYHSRPLMGSASTSSSLNGSEYGDDDDLSSHSMAFNETDTLNSSMLHAPSVNRTLLQDAADLHPCPQCERLFTWKTNLRRHEKTVHGMIGDRAFVKKVPSSAHASTFDGGKAFQCEFCDCSYDERVNLRRHHRERHGVDPATGGLLSDKSGKEYNGQIPIEEPLPLNDDDALPWLKKYECMDCHLAYATQDELDIHDMARHEHRRIQTSFVCAYCPATFATHERCTRHEQNHVLMPRYACSASGSDAAGVGACGAKFYVPMMKKYHESLMHLDACSDGDQDVDVESSDDYDDEQQNKQEDIDTDDDHMDQF